MALRRSSRGAGTPSSRGSGGARSPQGSGIRSAPKGSGIRSSPKSSGVGSALEPAGTPARASGRGGSSAGVGDGESRRAPGGRAGGASRAGRGSQPSGRGRGGRTPRRAGGRGKSKGSLFVGIGGLVFIAVLIIGSRIACSVGVMEYQDSQFRGEAKSVAVATDDPQYWNFLVDEFHDSALANSKDIGRRGVMNYDPDKYVDYMIDKIRIQLDAPDPAVVARFKAQHGREPHLTTIDESKIPQ